MKTIFSCLFLLLAFACEYEGKESDKLVLNDRNYFERPGENIMVFEDIYPEGHQGGIGIVQHGVRVATNGDLRLEPTPGQWSPIPKVGKRTIDREHNRISVRLWYPDSSIDRKGFNPVIYPDLHFYYTVNVTGEGDSLLITVNLDKPLPDAWIGKVGFNMELYPTDLFGKSWIMDGRSGIFPRQADGPVTRDQDGETQAVPLAVGRKLVIAPESDAQRILFKSLGEDIQLLDGRIRHTNGWFVIRSLVKAGATKNAIQWIIKVHTIPGWKYTPVVHVSQVGYRPEQPKVAVIEQDDLDNEVRTARLYRITPDGKHDPVLTGKPSHWGKFLRYNYLQFDFSGVRQPGLYQIKYGKILSNPFSIDTGIYRRTVWQPTLEYFLPVQMCHMRVNDSYKVWHGACHMDDALMAPVDSNHFDGYRQGPSTLTHYKPGQHVPGLDAGGWHDAGDDDLRIESQAGTVLWLALTWEEFHPALDATTIDQRKHVVTIHEPDGKPDILQQIEQGVLTILGGYENMGRVYRGIISPTLSQYTLVGDVSNQTNNRVYNQEVKYDGTPQTTAGLKDDRMVFTEENPSHEFSAVVGLAAAARVLKDYDGNLSARCLRAAEGLWNQPRTVRNRDLGAEISAASELFLTTRKEVFRSFLVQRADSITGRVPEIGWTVARTLPYIHDEHFSQVLEKALSDYAGEIVKQEKETPFGVPYRPYIWGAGWNIQEFGAHQYYLSKYFPKSFHPDRVWNALNFVLGCHPGENTASFASGVGTKSMTIAYGYNRADWSYIPGGVVSGTALIRPDLPELKDFPFLWQQAEYVMGGGATHYMFLVLAADKLLSGSTAR